MSRVGRPQQTLARHRNWGARVPWTRGAAVSWSRQLEHEDASRSRAWTRVEARGQPAATTLNEQRSQQLRDAARGSGHEPRAEAVDWPDAVIASQMSRGAGRGAAASRGTRAAPKSWSSQSELNSRCAELASHKRRWSATATEAGARASGQRRNGSRPTVGLGAQRSCVATSEPTLTRGLHDCMADSS
jgi:hypothetical protein